MKLQFYWFMVKYFVHEKMHLEVAKAYQTLYDTISKAPAELGLDPTGDIKRT